MDRVNLKKNEGEQKKQTFFWYCSIPFVQFRDHAEMDKSADDRALQQKVTRTPLQSILQRRKPIEWTNSLFVDAIIPACPSQNRFFSHGPTTEAFSCSKLNSQESGNERGSVSCCGAVTKCSAHTQFE